MRVIYFLEYMSRDDVKNCLSNFVFVKERERKQDGKKPQIKGIKWCPQYCRLYKFINSNKSKANNLKLQRARKEQMNFQLRPM